MKFNTKHIAITAGLGAVLALSPVVGPVSTAFAATTDGTVRAAQGNQQGHFVGFSVTDPKTGTQVDYSNYRTDGNERVDAKKIPQLPTYEDYEFVGWKAADGTVYQANKLSSLVVIEDSTFETVWKYVGTDKPTEDEKQSSGTVYFYVDDQCYTITLTNDWGSSFSEYVDQFEKDYPTATLKDGYIFQGWVDESGNAVDDNLVITNSGDSATPDTLTVKAVFTKKQEAATHTVNFYDENGKCVCTTAKSGDQPLSAYISMLQQSGFDTSREGHALTWTTASGDVVLESDIVAGDLDLYARWDAIHTVNFFDKDGKGLGTIALAGDQQLSAYTDRLAEGVEIPYVEGYTFTGWATKSGDAVLSTDTISGDLNLYAQYEKNPAIYTVNFFDQDGKGLCTIALAGDHPLQDFIDALYETDGVEVPFKDGCSIEWVTRSGDVVLPTDVIQGTINLYVNFKQAPATHTINFFDADGKGLATIAKSGELSFSEYTDTLAESGIEAPYKEGYTFTGWATKSGDVILAGDVIAGDINVYATYQKNAAVHTVNFFDEDGKGLGTIANMGDKPFSVYTDMLAEGVQVPEKDGYIFAGWVTKSGDKILGSDIISGDLNVYASYEKIETPATETHKVTFDDCLESTENQVVEVEDGKTVAKPADPTCEGYTFLGWFSDTALTQEFDFATPITADMTLYAKWQENADEQPGTDEPGTEEPGETPTTPGESTETPAAGEQGSSDEGASNGLPQTGDIAAVAVAGTGVLGAAVAGIGAFIGKRRK